jgi:hypothetical protein
MSRIPNTDRGNGWFMPGWRRPRTISCPKCQVYILKKNFAQFDDDAILFRFIKLVIPNMAFFSDVLN